MEKPVRFLEALEVMGEGFNRTVEDILVGMQSSPKQSCRGQDPRRGQNIAMEGPCGRRGLGCKDGRRSKND